MDGTETWFNGLHSQETRRKSEFEHFLFREVDLTIEIYFSVDKMPS